jgi:predicted RND superfamily exporter protein
VHHGFDGQEMISFFLNRGVRGPADLERVLRLTEAAKERFGDTVLSLAEIPAYQDDGTQLRTDPYISAEALQRPDFRLQEWQARVQQDQGIFGVFVARDFSWTAVVRYLRPGEDEIQAFRHTVEFVEGRKIPWWEWLWKTDIVPREPGLGVGGWVMGRGMLDQDLTVDMLRLVFLGVGLTFPLFSLLLGNLRHALLAVGMMIGLGFFCTRGFMGLMGSYERVFALLAYANVVVQGTSFALHKFAALAESRATDQRARWQEAASVDEVIVITALIAAVGFGTLYTFDLLPIRELALASGWGVVWLLVLAVVFLPALDLLFVKSGTADRGPGRPQRESHTGGSLLDAVVSMCARAVTWLAVGTRAWGALGVVGATFGVVALLFSGGEIVSRTRALEFVRGTLVERQARLLNQPGNPGFEFLDLLVEPGQGGDLYEPRFLRRAWAYQEALHRIAGARETISILPTLHKISQESYHTAFPETPEESADAITLLESDLPRMVARQLYFPGGLRISVSYGFDDSVELGRFCADALALAHSEFPDLKVNAFNTVPLYPRADVYVREGKVWNVFSSQIALALIYGGLLWWRNRRQRGLHVSPVWGGLVMCVPLFFATAVVGLVMFALDIALDMATASIGALTINAATDFSLYLALSYQDALRDYAPLPAMTQVLGSEGKIIVMDCLLNTVCFLPLVISNFVPVSVIGWMMAVMLVTCAVGTLLVMAALLPKCVRGQEVTA